MFKKPAKHPVRMTVAVVLCSVALNLVIAALHGWGPDPWWQAGVSGFLTTLAIMCVWGAFGLVGATGQTQKAKGGRTP